MSKFWLVLTLFFCSIVYTTSIKKRTISATSSSSSTSSSSLSKSDSPNKRYCKEVETEEKGNHPAYLVNRDETKNDEIIIGAAFITSTQQMILWAVVLELKFKEYTFNMECRVNKVKTIVIKLPVVQTISIKSNDDISIVTLQKSQRISDFTIDSDKYVQIRDVKDDVIPFYKYMMLTTSAQVDIETCRTTPERGAVVRQFVNCPSFTWSPILSDQVNDDVECLEDVTGIEGTDVKAKELEAKMEKVDTKEVDGNSLRGKINVNVINVMIVRNV
jgi:hypothetical protein